MLWDLDGVLPQVSPVRKGLDGMELPKSLRQTCEDFKRKLVLGPGCLCDTFASLGGLSKVVIEYRGLSALLTLNMMYPG